MADLWGRGDWCSTGDCRWHFSLFDEWDSLMVISKNARIIGINGFNGDCNWKISQIEFWWNGREWRRSKAIIGLQQ